MEVPSGEQRTRGAPCSEGQGASVPCAPRLWGEATSRVCVSASAHVGCTLGCGSEQDTAALPGEDFSERLHVSPGPRQELTPVHGASGRPELPIWRWVLSVRWVTQQGRPERSPPSGDLGFLGFLVRSGNPVADRQPLPSHPLWCSVASCARQTWGSKGVAHGPSRRGSPGHPSSHGACTSAL